MRERLEDLIRRFNERAEQDEKLRADLEGVERLIRVITEKDQFYMRLKDCRIGGLHEGQSPDADVTISADEETLKGLLEGRIPVFKALATGRLKIKASLEDTLRLRKLIS